MSVGSVLHPYFRFFSSDSYISAIILLCDIQQLASLAAVNRRFRRSCRSHIQSRILTALREFIRPCDFLQFFTLLDKTDSAIIGSVAHAALVPWRTWSPLDLNLSIPRHSFIKWDLFMKWNGYQGYEIGKKNQRVHSRYCAVQKTTAKTVHVYHHPELQVWWFSVTLWGLLNARLTGWYHFDRKP